MRLAALVIAAAALFAVPLAAQPAAQPAPDDAWPLYDKAAKRIREGDKLGKNSPATSSFGFNSYPPFSSRWEKLAKDAYEFNASAFEAVHQAAALKVAHWPVIHEGKEVRLTYLSDMRNIAGQVGDAAMYDHVHGRDRLALQRVADLLHVADLLDEPSDELIVQFQVAFGIRALVLTRLQVIATELDLTRERQQKDDAGGAQLVPVETVRSLIKQLFTLDDPTTRAKDLIEHEKAVDEKYEVPPDLEQLNRFLRLDQMERNLTAMSLACQIVRFDKGHWPASLDELVAELPAAPADAWGPMGYALVQHARPDGSHRPVVYSRYGVGETGTLFYPTGWPQFGYYNANGVKNAPVAGQFRDVSLWAPGNRPAGVQQLR
jgi:hypothetical protein